MAKAKGTATVWLAQLDRFGYTLTAIGNTKEEAIKIVMNEYSKAFKERNDGTSPSKMSVPYGAGSYYANAKEDIWCLELELGKCYWL